MDLTSRVPAAMTFLLAALTFPSVPLPAFEEEPGLVLFDFGPGFDLGSVAASDARVALAPGGGLAVRTGHEKEWPGVTLKAPEGKWDLSPRSWIAATVTNRSAGEITVHLRVDNPGADGREHCVTGSLTLSAGAAGEIRVPLSSTPWRLTKPIELVGMRGAPGAAEKLDPGNVTQLVFFVTKPGADRQFEIGRIAAGGRAVTLDAEKFFPFIDELGQFIHSDWPGKMHSLEELEAARRSEEKDLAEHPGPADRDQYGGWTGGPKLEATGIFRVEKREGKWWLVDPEGRLFRYSEK